MATLEYLTAIHSLLDRLAETQLIQIDCAATLVAKSLLNGGAIFCSTMGHSSEMDFINRAGGLAAVQRFTYNFSCHAPLPLCYEHKVDGDTEPSYLQQIQLAVASSNLRPGDVMVMSSVSGRNSAAIELALACRNKGLTVIGLTSLEYAAQVQSLHPSGKMLGDVVDVVLDIFSPYGDAVVEVPNFPDKILPISGVSMLVIGWLLWGLVVEKMVSAGQPPVVYPSINIAEGETLYHKRKALYHLRGF